MDYEGVKCVETTPDFA